MCSCCATANQTSNALVPPKWYNSQTDFSCCDTYFPCDNCCCACNCCCCLPPEPLSQCRISLAWLIEGPSCKQLCAPFGWEINLVDTPSEINRTCNEFIEWVNCPPCPPCQTCNGHCPKKRAITYLSADCINNSLRHCLNDCACVQRQHDCNCHRSCGCATAAQPGMVAVAGNDGGKSCSICGDYMERPELCICPCCHLPIKPDEQPRRLSHADLQGSPPSAPSTPIPLEHSEAPVRLSNSKISHSQMLSKHQIASKSRNALPISASKPAIHSRHPMPDIRKSKSRVTLREPRQSQSQSMRKISSQHPVSTDSSISETMSPVHENSSNLAKNPNEKSMQQLFESDLEYNSNYVTVNTALMQPNHVSNYPIYEPKKGQIRNVSIQCELLVQSPVDGAFDYGNQKMFQNDPIYDYQSGCGKKKKKFTTCYNGNQNNRSKCRNGSYFFNDQATYEYVPCPRKQTKPKSLCFCDKVNVMDIPCNDFYL